MSEKILIVDDEKEIRKVLTARIEYAGYKVESVDNGREAIGAYFETQYLDKDPFSLIILDIMMPGINGLEVLQIIRKEEELMGIKYEDGIPIIMLTALEDAWRKSFNKGCDDYLIKPYEPEDLVAKIKVKLNERKELFKKIEEKLKERERNKIN
ncbi:MAG: response regulator [bacterium]